MHPSKLVFAYWIKQKIHKFALCIKQIFVYLQNGIIIIFIWNNYNHSILDLFRISICVSNEA